MEHLAIAMPQKRSQIRASQLILQEKIESNSFHSAMQLPLQISQFFGYFPLYVGGSNHRSLQIKWRSWRMVYSLITITLFSFELIIIIYANIPYEHNILTIDGIVFATYSFIQSLLFLKLTLEWPKFVKDWNNVESRVGDKEIKGNLKRQLTIIVLSVLIVATVEHFLINTYSLRNSLKNASTISDGFKRYFYQSYGSVLNYLEYSFWLGAFLEFVNLQMAFIWNFADVLIMAVGSALKFKLNQIVQRMKILNKTTVSDRLGDLVNNMHVWRHLRKDYLRIVTLCQSTNEKLSLIILVSFLVNLYFVLKQIFRSLSPLRDSMEKAYFYISFILMVLRISMVIFLGSGVQDEWKEIGVFLQSVPSSAYNEEVERFISNIASFELVLTGRNFFNIRRGLILKIAGTIVTYELVIIQFHTEMFKSTEI